MERASDVLALLGLPCSGDGSGDGAAAPPGEGQRGRRRGRRLRLCLRSQGSAKRLARSAAQQALVAQVQNFNRSGSARTADHLIMPPGLPRVRVRGQGRWKAWTPEAVLRAAFHSPTQSARSAGSAVGGGSGSHALACRAVVARCIEEQQQRGVRRLRAESLAANSSEGPPLKFLIRNCMWDETQLSLRAGGQLLEQSVLAQHMQLSWVRGDGAVTDADLVRPPAVLAETTAAAMWSALTAGGDQLGLALGPAGLPAAVFHGLLSTCDGAAANRLLVKHMATQPGSATGRTMQLSCFCAQHSMGSVVELVTRHLSILSPTFQIALTMRRGSFMRDLRVEVRRLLGDRLRIVSEDHGSQADAAFGRALLAECFVAEGQSPADCSTRKALAERFMEFFSGSWEGGAAVVDEGRCWVDGLALAQPMEGCVDSVRGGPAAYFHGEHGRCLGWLRAGRAGWLVDKLRVG